MGQIVSVHAREILDSRGNPTIEVDVMTTWRGTTRIM
jgi:enolase